MVDANSGQRVTVIPVASGYVRPAAGAGPIELCRRTARPVHQVETKMRRKGSQVPSMLWNIAKREGREDDGCGESMEDQSGAKGGQLHSHSHRHAAQDPAHKAVNNGN